MADTALAERVQKLEEDNAHLATAFSALLMQLVEMWHRHAEMDQNRGNPYAAHEWEAYAARLVALTLKH